MGRVQTATLIALALCACGKPKPAVPPTVTPAVEAPAAKSAQVQAFVTGKGEGEDEAAAYAQAQAKLAEALLGDARWLTVMPTPLHDATLDPYQAVQGADGWEVAIGLEEGRTATALDAFTYTQPQLDGPEAWHDALYEALAAHAAKVVCERRAALYSVACDAPSIESEDASLRRLGTDLELSSLVLGGVPTDADGIVLRPARVLVTWNGAPVDGLPLLIDAPDGSKTNARTNADGVAELPVAVGAPWPGAFTVAVDAAKMVGPLEGLSSWPSLEVQARTLDPHRWALVFKPGTRPDGTFAKTLQESLTAKLGTPVELDAGTERTLGKVGLAERARVLAALADSMGGQLDVVVLVGVTSRFASRAGGSRVWWEGSSELWVHEVWAAGELGREDFDSTASGMGDRRADAAVRRKLAEEASRRVMSALRPGPK